MDIENKAWQDAIKEITEKLANNTSNLQTIHTPFELVNCMIGKLKENVELKDKTFCVFNLEFVEALIYDYGVARDRIWFVTDCPEKAKIMGHNRYKGVVVARGNFLKTEMIMKFDVVIGNPPYQAQQEQKGKKRGGGASLWDKFVFKSFSICKDNGYITLIHPSMWRKPESKNSKNKGLWERITEKQMLYLEIHNSQDGMRMFNAGTRYDWYIIHNKPYEKPTITVDEDAVVHKIDLRNWNFLPNKNYDLIEKILAKEEGEKCPLIWNTFYHTAIGRYNYVNETQDKNFKYPLVHSTNKNENRFYWTNLKNKGHFGISKVIFGESGINNCIIDMNGEYGMTHCSMAIKVESLKEAEAIKKALESEKFKILLESVSWGNFRIDWRLFRYFRKDFWKEFVDEKVEVSA